MVLAPPPPPAGDISRCQIGGKYAIGGCSGKERNERKKKKEEMLREIEGTIVKQLLRGR
jgi:hypothetical protein